MPVLDVSLALGTPVARLPLGPALLLTHHCSLDKKSKGISTLESVTFLRLQDVTALPKDRQANLRASAGKLQPYNAMYLGQVPDLGESYVMLTDPYSLPAATLRPDLREYDADQSSGEPGTYLTATDYDTRVAQVTAEGLNLLRRKWIVHWTRLEPRPVEEKNGS